MEIALPRGKGLVEAAWWLSGHFMPRTPELAFAIVLCLVPPSVLGLEVKKCCFSASEVP